MEPVEYRKIGERILCKIIGAFKESEFACGVADRPAGREMQAVAEKRQAGLIIDDATKDIPVVFLTGPEDKQKIMERLSLHPAGDILKHTEITIQNMRTNE